MPYSAVAILAFLMAPADPRLTAALQRLAREAEAFAREATWLVAEETLEQRVYTPQRVIPEQPPAPKTPPAPAPPPPRLTARRGVLSEYGFTTLQDEPNSLRELRRVLSVDGRQVLTLDLRSEVREYSDKEKRLLLEDFSKHTLGAATIDFGQIILLFTPRGQEQYQFDHFRSDSLDGRKALVWHYSPKKKKGGRRMTVFEGEDTHRQEFTGEVWFSETGYEPLRITLVSTREARDGKVRVQVRQEATINYRMTSFGVLAPSSIVHWRSTGGSLDLENIFQYSEFRKSPPRPAPKNQ